MKRVLTAAVLVPVVLLIVFRGPLWVFALAVAAIIVLTLHEYMGIAEAAGIQCFRPLVHVTGVFPVFLLLLSIVMEKLTGRSRVYWTYSPEPSMLWAWWRLMLLAPVIFGIPLVFKKEIGQGLASVAASVLGIIYIGASLSLLIAMRWDVAQAVLIIFTLCSVWAGDIAAYYIGKNFGRHKLAPVVSPNKSWEGAVASIIASIAVAFLILHYRGYIIGWFSFAGKFMWDVSTPTRPVSAVHAVILGTLTNVAAQFGDLFESALKRGASVKDSGTLLPGHGGILDRIDALLFAIPVVWYYAQITQFLAN
jgi:phosphatidate cytidylyltransferase